MNAKNCLVAGQSNKQKRTDDVETGSFAFETVQAGLIVTIPDAADRAVAMAQLEASRRGLCSFNWEAPGWHVGCVF